MNPAKRLLEELRKGISPRQTEHGTTLRPDELGWGQEELAAQPLQRRPLQAGRGTQALEPVEQVIGQQ